MRKYLSIVVDAALLPEKKRGCMQPAAGINSESGFFSPSSGRGRDHGSDHTEQYIL